MSFPFLLAGERRVDFQFYDHLKSFPGRLPASITPTGRSMFSSKPGSIHVMATDLQAGQRPDLTRRESISRASQTNRSGRQEVSRRDEEGQFTGNKVNLRIIAERRSPPQG
jgi:hypothetical protein